MTRLAWTAVAVACCCAAREQGMAFALRLGAVGVWLALLPWAVQRWVRPADAPQLLAAGLGFGALALSGLCAPFARRHRVTAPWLRSLPQPPAAWPAFDVLAVVALAALLAAPLFMVALAAHLLTAAGAALLALAYLLLATGLALLSCLALGASFAWSVALLVGWLMVTLPAVVRWAA